MPSTRVPGKVEKRYYLPGAILFPDKTKEIVVFANSCDHTGICYHRGFERHGNRIYQEIMEGNYSFNFSAYENIGTKKSSIQNLRPVLCPEHTQKEENDLFVRLDDQRNNVEIELYKVSNLTP